MQAVVEKIEFAQKLFREKMTQILEDGGLTQERYFRFLTCQYHLTRGVQRHFYRMASHSSMASRKEMRDWLVQFAKEEEFHFEIARKDLLQLGTEPGEGPVDIQLWWHYFNSVVDDRPFVRLGGTCILENIGEGSADIIDKMLRDSDFLTPSNTRFLTIHRHGPNLDHGNQVVQNIEKAKLNDEERQDLLLGCDNATTFYMRFMHWMSTGELLK